MKTFNDFLNDIALIRGHRDYTSYIDLHEKMNMLRYTQSFYLDAANQYANHKLESAKKDIQDLKKIIEINEQTINISQSNYDTAARIIKTLEEQIELLKKKRGFWYNLFYYITH